MNAAGVASFVFRFVMSCHRPWSRYCKRPVIKGPPARGTVQAFPKLRSSRFTFRIAHGLSPSRAPAEPSFNSGRLETGLLTSAVLYQ